MYKQLFKMPDTASFSKKVILHIVRDSIHTNSVLEAFEKDGRFTNISLFITKRRKTHSIYLSLGDNVNVVSGANEARDFLRKTKYDAIFFHSMDVPYYILFKYIPQSKIVIWWQWGYEIYSDLYGLAPLLPTDLYKPQTKIIVKSINRRFYNISKRLLGYLIFNRKYKKLQSLMLNRIDYYQPVIPIEYKLMKESTAFRAKEFYYPGCFQYKEINFYTKPQNGNLVIGNSATIDNNHVDVWHDIEKFIPDTRKIFLPASYGDKEYMQLLHKYFSSKKVEIIKEFMPLKQYRQILDSCSYAVFGVIRQQAMGNINYCLSHGCKVFLYEDSLVYKCLREYGFCVFSIESIDENSFMEPLSYSQMQQNKMAFMNEVDYVNKVRDKALEEILSR